VGTDPEVVRRVEEAVGVLEQAGARVEEVELAHGKAAEAAHMVITHAEAFAAHRPRLRAHWSRYGAFTRLLIAQGALVSGPEYVQAQRVRTLVSRSVVRLFERVDLVVTPTIGIPAPRLDADFLALLPLFFTGYWNLVGTPALSVPVGPVDGLPVGMQLVGRPHEEATVLRAGDAFQQRTKWHLARPALP
jgi:aspartyl-tRNA(Asn)/glutamyl-tRNA(Gln) amidotransferase subunit A